MQERKVNYENVARYARLGWHDLDWYERAEELLKYHYGVNWMLAAQVMAATSINSTLKSNVRLMRKAMHELTNGLPLSNYLPNIKAQLERVRDGRGLHGQKIVAFAAAMMGDTEAVVVDTWLLRAFDMGRRYMRKVTKNSRHGHLYTIVRESSGGATKGDFDFITEKVRDMAVMNDVEPRQMSAAIWSGVRINHTRDFNTNYHTVLNFQNYNMYENSTL